jgi:hypothetical protein
MLGKLFKYEFRATGRILLPIYGAVVVMGIISSIFLKVQPDLRWDNKFLMLASILSMVLFFGLIVASVGLSFVISIYRYKKNLLGDEGYLMNTLPVSVWQNVAAKLTAATLFQIIGVIVACIAGFLFFVVGSNISSGEFFAALNRMAEFFASNVDGSVWLIIIEMCFAALFSMTALNMMIYASMSVGHSMTAHKVMNSVLVYIGFYIISQFINMFLIFGVSTIFENTMLIAENNAYLPQLGLAGVIFLEAAYTAVYFAVTNYFMKYKLNLQ